MYWRIVLVVCLLVVASYAWRTLPVVASTETYPIAPPRPSPVAASVSPAPDGMTSAPLVFPPNNISLPAPPAIVAGKAQPAEAEERFSFDLRYEAQRITAAAGVSVGAFQLTDRLPAEVPMAVVGYRKGACVLQVAADLTTESMMFSNLSAYGQRVLAFSLSHEIGHCYVLTHIAHQDAAILPSLSPPGRTLNAEQYIVMLGKYSEFPDVNRWNEEWADAFAVFILNKVYGKPYAVTVASEIYAMRKGQEHDESVMVSNVYGGHASLADSALFTIQSPLEIANIIKADRLNTTRR